MDDSSAADVAQLFENNRRWASRMVQEDPEFFSRLAAQQKPKFLWIGCSDSRVPANQITGLAPGEVFVHRNVANVVSATDLNCMSVVDFAIRQIKVRHVIICGHYGCAGVQAAAEEGAIGVTDSWLSGIRDLWDRHKQEFSYLAPGEQQARLCELNVDRSADSPGGDAVDPDTIGSHFLRDTFHHEHDATLGSRVIDVAGPRNDLMHRTDTNHLPCGTGDRRDNTAALELPDGLPGAEELPRKVDR